MGIGLSWWQDIIILTLASRVLLFPLTLIGQKNAVRLKNANPDLQELNSQPMGIERQAQLFKIHEKHGASMKTTALCGLAQAPIFISMFTAFRNLGLYDPTYMTGGTQWFMDLSLADPYYILPAVATLASIANIQFNVDGAVGATSSMKRVVQLVVVFAGFFWATLESGCCLYIVVTTLYGIAQHMVLSLPSVRKLLNFPEEIVYSKKLPDYPFTVPKQRATTDSTSASGGFWDQIRAARALREQGHSPRQAAAFATRDRLVAAENDRQLNKRQTASVNAGATAVKTATDNITPPTVFPSQVIFNTTPSSSVTSPLSKSVGVTDKANPKVTVSEKIVLSSANRPRKS